MTDTVKTTCRHDLARISRAITSRAVLAILVTCAVAGTLMIQSGVASAASRGYKIYNLSSHPLRLESVTPVKTVHCGRGGCTPSEYPMEFEGRPKDGAILEPGAVHDWELKYQFLSTYAADLKYTIVGTNATYEATLMTSTFTNDSTCAIPGNLGICKAGGLTLTVTDRPGTMINIPAGQGQAQAETLHRLCQDSNIAKCDFEPVKEDQTQTGAHPTGDAVANCGDTPVDTVYKASDTLAQTNSIGVSVSAGTRFFDIINASITATYNHAWTQKHTFEQDVSLHVKPGFKAWVTSLAPIFRDTGDFKLKLGNTTWKLPGVYFDTPDPDRAGQYVAHDAKLTPNERKMWCKSGSKRLVRVPVSSILGRGVAPGNGHASVGHAKVEGTTARVFVRCTGALGARCRLAFRMPVTERIRDKKVIAISARTRPRTRTVIVTVASARTVMLRAGRARMVKMSLNKTGKRILARHCTLRVPLYVTQILGASGSQTTLAHIVTFKANCSLSPAT